MSNVLKEKLSWLMISYGVGDEGVDGSKMTLKFHARVFGEQWSH